MVWAQESIHACLQVWVEYDRPAEGVVDSNWRFDNLCHSIFRVKMSCKMSTYGIKLWLLISLVS